MKPESETWAGLYMSALPLTEAIDSGKVRLTGDKGEIEQVFEMFDRFQPAMNIAVPSLDDMPQMAGHWNRRKKVKL